MLGIDRETVTRYARLAAAAPGGPPPLWAQALGTVECQPVELGVVRRVRVVLPFKAPVPPAAAGCVRCPVVAAVMLRSCSSCSIM